jgi:hypothetical protein
MRFKIPDSATEFPTNYFQSITDRFARAGWIEGTVIETAVSADVHYTALGRDRMRRLEEVIRPFVTRASAALARKLSIAGKIKHVIAVEVLKLRCTWIAGSLGWPPLSSQKLEKLIAFVITGGRK